MAVDSQGNLYPVTMNLRDERPDQWYIVRDIWVRDIWPSHEVMSKEKARMRVSVFCGVSVDGFLARPDDTFDFLKAGEAVPHGFTTFLNSVDVVVIGRRTFDVVRNLGHFELYGKKQVMVLSGNPLDFSSIQDANLEQMSGTPQQIVAQLEKRGFRHAYVDGGITIQAFLRAGLVHRITITRVPVLIGQGIPLFGPVPQDIHLRHVRTRSYKGGMVQSQYEMSKVKKKRPSLAAKRKKRK